MTEVAELADAFEVTDGSIPERYLERSLNEWDEYAIEEAVTVAEDSEDVEVVTVTVGPPRVEETIRIALAKGVDRAIRIWDDDLADRDLLDVDVKTTLLTAVVADEEPDLVFTGVQAHDDGFGATGVSLADAVGYEWAAVVNDLDIHADGTTATVHRELEGGLEEIVDVDLPAVLTIQTGINDPRYASLRGIRQAQGKEIGVRDLADLGLEGGVSAGDLALVDMYVPDTEDDAVLFEGDAGAVADQLVDLFQERGVLQRATCLRLPSTDVASGEL